MEFGMLTFSEIGPGTPDSFRSLADEAQEAERAGFDYYNLIERHQGQYGEFSAPLPWLAALAAVTTRIRLGITVLLLPLHHPVELAENLAAVDRISGGRLVVGVGLGYQDRDFAPFGIPVKERVRRFSESMELIRQSWSNDTVSFQGTHYQLDGVRVSPRPLQNRVPFWGGGMAEAAIERVAGLCDAWMTGPTTLPSQLETLVPAYRAAAEAKGKRPKVILFRDCWIADSFAAAREAYGPSLIRHDAEIHRDAGSAGVLGNQVDVLPQSPDGDHPFLMGSADDIIRRIDQYRDRFGIDGLIVRMRTSFGPDPALVRGAIRRFGDEVIAHYKRH